MKLEVDSVYRTGFAYYVEGRLHVARLERPSALRGNDARIGRTWRIGPKVEQDLDRLARLEKAMREVLRETETSLVTPGEAQRRVRNIAREALDE